MGTVEAIAIETFVTKTTKPVVGRCSGETNGIGIARLSCTRVCLTTGSPIASKVHVTIAVKASISVGASGIGVTVVSVVGALIWIGSRDKFETFERPIIR